MSSSNNLVRQYLNSSDESGEQYIATNDESNNSQNSQNQKKSSHWGKEEHNRYLEYCKKNQDILNGNRNERRKVKIFKRMAEYVRTRNHLQCKTHHQKQLEKYKKEKEPEIPQRQQNQTSIFNNQLYLTNLKMEESISNINQQQNNLVNLLFLNIPSKLAQTLQQVRFSLENKLEEVVKAENVINKCLNCQNSQPPQNYINDYIQKQLYSRNNGYLNQINQEFSYLNNDDSSEENSVQISNFQYNQEMESSCSKQSTPGFCKKQMNQKQQLQQQNIQSPSKVQVKKIKKRIVKAQQKQ